MHHAGVHKHVGALAMLACHRMPQCYLPEGFSLKATSVLAKANPKCRSWADVWRGIAGDDTIQPYGILILFMALAYVGASVDSTGIFAYIALRLTYMWVYWNGGGGSGDCPHLFVPILSLFFLHLRAKGHGPALFILYFLLSSFITTFTSNDVCIVTLTPIM